jgi:crossover junction endodeoxyribonuclease RusA
MISFTVDGEPASKARARFTGRGSKVRAFTPERTREAESRVAAAYLAVAKRLNAGDVSTAFGLTAEFHLARNQRRDIDNMLKLVLDGLNKVAWADDSQVVEITARKVFHAGTGRTVVAISDVGTIPRSVATCEHCGAEFPRPPSHAAKKFCSQECRSASLKARRMRSCKHCGEKFTGGEDRRYCSAECKYAAGRMVVRCAQCGTAFERPRSLNRSGNAYCSDACKATYWRDHRKSAPKGTCQDCGGPTTKAQYRRCRDCSYAAGGRHAEAS